MNWAAQLNDAYFRFVTRGPAWAHVLVFGSLGVVAGLALVRWIERLFAYDPEFARPLASRERTAVVAGLAGLYTALVLAVVHGNCQSLTEGGHIDWLQWRLLYQYILLALLVAATAVDLDQYMIPDEITLPGVLIGVGAATAIGNMQLMQIWVDWNQADPIRGPYIPAWIKSHPHLHGLAWSVAGILAGAGITWCARLVSRLALGTEALGFGDVTLMAMIGSFLGWQPIVFVFLLAPMCGVIGGVALRIAQNRRALPYGPCLSAAAVIVLFTWRWLWQATREIFGHWPTLLLLFAIVIAGMAVLLILLRLYRRIPVERRKRAEGG